MAVEVLLEAPLVPREGRGTRPKGDPTPVDEDNLERFVSRRRFDWTLWGIDLEFEGSRGLAASK